MELLQLSSVKLPTRCEKVLNWLHVKKQARLNGLELEPEEKHASMRDRYGEVLKDLAKQHSDLVGLTADLGESTRIFKVAEVDPSRYFNFGIAEQSMMDTAAGMALSGKLVFVSTFAVFATGRAWEQIRNVMAHDNLNIKLVCTHGGLTVCSDGSSHQILEDVGLMRALPNMTVIVPADANETEAAVRAAAVKDGPFYIRLPRPKTPVIYDKIPEFKIGKANLLNEGADATIIGCGLLLYEAKEAARLLRREGVSVRVLDVHTIKPIDKAAIEKAARETGAIVTVEEHNVINGLGSAVSEVVGETYPVPVRRVGVKDAYGQSGDYRELLEAYDLTIEEVLRAIVDVTKRKRK